MRISALILATTAYFGLAQSHKAEVFLRPERLRTEVLSKYSDLPGSPANLATQNDTKTDRFLTKSTRKFKVNSLPDANFDIGELYAGNLPISSAKNESRELFFIFAPALLAETPKEIVIWLNGGPGCSSLGGFLQENGPFLWQAGTFAPTQNTYAFNNLTNVLWVEQPVGVGFTKGVPDITNEEELARQFVGFYKQFIQTFNVQGWDLYITGESYAGFYVPYIANEVIKENNASIPLKGVSINDPIIGDETLQQAVAIQPFVEYWSNLLQLNSTSYAALAKQHKDCGYADYLAKYFTFPSPQKPFPVLPDAFSANDGRCDTFDSAVRAAMDVNPCFNFYHISDYCPFLYSVAGDAGAGYLPPGASVYFNRTDVQRALHAPVGTNWAICTPINVFGGSTDNQSVEDQSPAPATNGVLQRVIEYTNNTIIGSGNLDILLSTNGTLLALQNTTWNGHRGFKKYPGKQFYVPFHKEYNQATLSGAGILGSWGVERGLTFYQVQLAGHEGPQYAQGAAYRVLEYLLGRVHSLSDTRPFTA